MNPPPPTSLEYAPPRRGVPNRVVWKALSLFLLVGVTLLVFMPDLHNNNPFWRVWIVAAPLATFLIFRLTSFDRSPARSLFTVMFVVVLWALGVFAIHDTFTGIDPHVLTRAHFHCTDNLRAIAESLDLYAKAHAGRFPDRLEQLLDEANDFPLTADTLVVPFTTETPAKGSTTREVMSQVTAGGHCSYLYLGKGLTITCPPNTVLLYEPLTNHATNIKGIHLLTAGGLTGPRAPFLPERKARHWIAELDSGHNPPRPEPSR